MGKNNNIYTASYKLKVLSVAEQFGNREALTHFGIVDCNVRYWRKTKWDSRAHRGTKAGKSAYFTHPDFKRPN
jgi:hypothetical protein